MARTRLIKPGFFKNEQLGSLPIPVRYLFAGMWGQADREGRLEDRPMRLKAEILPYDNCDANTMLDQLAALHDDDGKPAFIIRYTVENKRFIQICNFLKHQSPHVKEQASTIQAPDMHQTCTEVAPLDPSSLDPSSTKKTLSDNGQHKPAKKQYTESFSHFWSEYPRKDGKQAALKAWAKVPSGLVDAIIASVEAHKQIEQWQRGIIPHASTFLNGKRWEDELEVAEHRNPLEGVIMG